MTKAQIGYEILEFENWRNAAAFWYLLPTFGSQFLASRYLGESQSKMASNLQNILVPYPLPTIKMLCQDNISSLFSFFIYLLHWTQKKNSSMKLSQSRQPSRLQPKMMTRVCLMSIQSSRRAGNGTGITQGAGRVVWKDISMIFFFPVSKKAVSVKISGSDLASYREQRHSLSFGTGPP